jgi:O-6-methylguanine DNA methyltransferase
VSTGDSQLLSACILFGSGVRKVPLPLYYGSLKVGKGNDEQSESLRMNFDEKIWKVMERIPKGRVTTYSQIAKKLDTKAYRAVGNACRRNPYAPRVPCHRVVRSDGTVGGFGGKTSGKTVEQKIQMLKKENVEVRNRKIANFEKVLFRF